MSIFFMGRKRCYLISEMDLIGIRTELIIEKAVS